MIDTEVKGYIKTCEVCGAAENLHYFGKTNRVHCGATKCVEYLNQEYAIKVYRMSLRYTHD